MEIGELVNVEIPKMGPDGKCPFAHEPPTADETNELGGIGTTLGKNMAGGIGIGHESRKTSFSEGKKELDPRDRPGRNQVRTIFVQVNGRYITLKEGTGPLPYPLVCAAHHLIPAQESLKGHDILFYMCRPDKDQDFRNSKDKAPAKVEDAQVWGNVAYNINGCQNGVWLPGNYAVGGGTGGAALWTSKANAKRSSEADDNWVDTAAEDWDRGDDDKEEEITAALRAAIAAANPMGYMLTGTNKKIDPGNPKWGYVKAAMDKTGAQFHDRHEPYSKQVKGYLDKIAEAYAKMHANSLEFCEECKKAQRPKGLQNRTDLLGPPYPIVGRLKAASDFFKQFLLGTGKGTKKKLGKQRTIYTSGWVDAWLGS